MRKHPSLAEVLDDQSDNEWLEVNITGFSVGDYADVENGKGQISSPSFNLSVGPSESEYGTISFNNGAVSIYKISNEALQNLEGEKPLGSINYYDPEHSGITLNLNESLYQNLIGLLSGLRGLSLRVSFPSLDNKEVKCLPLLSYQLIYKQELDSEI
ncbi:MAG: hypothetical protein JKX92_10430 [Porticoccaceae bacterium]|nr:hypothetical protein [Porticoccaceae bacterium]